MAPGAWPDTTTSCRKNPRLESFGPNSADLLKKAGIFNQVPPELWQKDWVVDIIAVGSGEAALKYLSPYVFRVAISNQNILALKDGRVTFCRRHSETGATKIATIPAQQFIHRFLQHVLPRNFQKVGLMASCIPSKGIPSLVSKNSYPSAIPTPSPDHIHYATSRIVTPHFYALPATAR